MATAEAVPPSQALTRSQSFPERNQGTPKIAPERKLSLSRHILVVDARGLNKVGITKAFIDGINGSCQGAQILDVVQYVIEGSLSITFMIEMGEGSSMMLMKEMLRVARELEMQLDFRFPECYQEFGLEPVEGNVISVGIVLTSSLTIDFVHQLFDYFASHSLQILEIEHRADNRIEINNELTKIEIRLSGPPEVTVPNLYLELQPLMWKFNANHVVRPYSAMNRPSGRSLVVFGLSDVLLHGCPLDDLLRKCGKDPGSVDMTGAKVLERYSRKVSALAGCDASCMQQVVEDVEFTPDADFVCRCLKALGFRIALLTSSGCKQVANTVKERFGIDYVLTRDLEVDDDGKFTGEFAGDVKDLMFRKTDFLQLMAEKESIPYKNVIVVGEFLKGMKRVNIPEILDTFGPPIFFNSSKQKSLIEVLYLLGFSGSDVKSFRSKYAKQTERRLSKSPSPDESVCNPQDPKTHSRCLLRLMGPQSDTCKLARIFESMQPFTEGGQCTIKTLKQRTLSESIIMGIQLSVNESDMQTLLKEALFACQTEGLTMEWEHNPKSKYLPAELFHGRHVVTIVQKPVISNLTLTKVLSHMSSMSCDILTLERVSKSNLSALQITCIVPSGHESDLRKVLLAAGKECHADIAFQEESVDRWSRRLIIFDMDSTLIQQEVIDELAKLANVEAAVKEITERAMSGELDFFASLKERVGLLKGHKADELFDHVKKNLIYTPGAKQLCSTLKGLGYKMAVISGGFLPVAREVQRELGLDYAFANTLEVDRATGLLTGRTIGPVVTPQRKRALLSMIAEVEGCDVSQTIAVGDGANDIPMLCTAGLGVAFCAKPKVQDIAEFRVNTLDLSTVLYLIGLSEFAAEEIENTSGPEHPVDESEQHNDM
jgi:phosphoserine phosphatase